MTTKQREQSDSLTDETALTKAIPRAADYLGIAKWELAEILGFSGSTATRLWSGEYLLESNKRKEWELATLFFRFYRSLDSIVGNQENARLWLRGTNSALESKPIDLIFKTEGLIDAIRYLDSHRGRIK